MVYASNDSVRVVISDSGIVGAGVGSSDLVGLFVPLSRVLSARLRQAVLCLESGSSKLIEGFGLRGLELCGLDLVDLVEILRNCARQ